MEPWCGRSSLELDLVASGCAFGALGFDLSRTGSAGDAFHSTSGRSSWAMPALIPPSPPLSQSRVVVGSFFGQIPCSYRDGGALRSS